MSNYTKTTNFAAKDSLPSGNAAKIVKGAEIDTEFNNIATASATKANANNAALTGTTVFATLSDGTIAITGWVDEDNMASNSAVLIPTQQSVKAYVDSNVTAQDLDVTDGTTSIDIDLDSESLGILGGTGLTSTASGTGVTLAIDSTVTTLTGTQTLTNKTLTTPVISGALTTNSTIDGRDVAVDGTKLDGIESGATADQTAAEIKTAYESNANTNAFTDSDESKLDGIEASADVTDTTNVTAAGALMDSELTNITAVKALNQGVATGDSPTFAAVNAPLTGNVTGNLTGNVTGNVTGDLTGDVTGNVTGNVSGNLTGSVLTAAQTNITSVGTLGALTVTGDVTVDTNTLKVDATNNRVGILNASPDVTLDIGTATDAVHMPTGTTAQRPTGSAGYFRYNSTLEQFEGYTDAWGAIGGGGGSNLVSDTMTGDGSDTTLTLSNDPLNENNTQVYIDGVYQNKDTYSVSGTTLTFSTAPPNGSAVEAMTIQPTAVNVPADASVTSAKLSGDLTTPGALTVTGTAEAHKVEIGDGSAGGTSEILFSDNVSGRGKILYDHSSNPETMLLQTTGSTAISIDNSQNVSIPNGSVGVGTSSPSRLAHLYGTSNPALRLDNGTNSVDIGIATSNGALLNGSSANDLVIARNGAYNIKFGTNGSTRATIDGSGNLLVGTTDTTLYANTSGGETGFSVSGDGSLQAARQTTTATQGLFSFNKMGVDGNILEFYKDGATVGSIGVQSSRPYFGNSINFSIKCDDFGGGSLIPANQSGTPNDNLADIGTSGNRWDNIYATNGTIQTSDRNEKQDIVELSDAEQRVAVACKGLLRKFRWIDAVEAKGDDARIHFGIIAQDLQAAFEAEGLDAARYAMFTSNTWWETQTEVAAVEATEDSEAVDAYTRTDTYDTAEEAPEGATERTRLGVRYSELLAFIISAI